MSDELPKWAFTLTITGRGKTEYSAWKDALQKIAETPGAYDWDTAWIEDEGDDEE